MVRLGETPLSDAEYLKRLADQASQEGRREQCVELIAALYDCFGDHALPATAPPASAHRNRARGDRLAADVDEPETVGG